MAGHGALINTVNKAKPLLKKILPAPVLRAGKKMALRHMTDEIRKTELLPYEKGAFPAGINLIGPIDSATGLGQSFRLVERVIAEMGVPYLIYNYDQNTNNKVDAVEYSEKIQSELKYSINLWHVNPMFFAEMYAVMGRESFDRRYNIAYWLWELEEFPNEWVPYIRLLDEIWTPSEFISKGIRKKTDKPVCTMPYYVTARSDVVKYGRKYFGLSENQFLFLMMYDMQSISERKNPEGVIRTFQMAFPPERTDVGLVIKVNSANDRDMKLLREKLENYRNVYLINRNLEKIQVNSLIASADVFVSLHRAEGFGLVLAEAMLNHVPTIATNWSANTEFMNEEVACMVDYHLQTLTKEVYPYKKGSRWAEPDMEQAAKYMKKLAEDWEFYHGMAERSYEYVKKTLGMESIKLIMKRRLQELL